MKTRQRKSIKAILLLTLVCVATVLLPSCHSKKTGAKPAKTIKAECTCAGKVKSKCTCENKVKAGCACDAKVVAECGCCDPYVTVKKVTNQETLVLGQQYKYEINLANDKHRCSLTDFTVTEMFSPNFKFVKAVPAPNKVNSSRAVWNFGDVNFNESRKITIYGTAKSSGKVTNCTKVVYNNKICNTVTVIEPKLKLTKTAPKEVILCDGIPVTLKVCNTGTGTITNVKVVDKLPSGLVEAKSGKNAVTFTVDSLPAGKCQEFSYDTKILRTGSYRVEAVATSKENVTDKAVTTTIVRRPVLEITKTGDAKAFVNRPYSYTITVSNVGDAVAGNLQIVDRIPAGGKCISLSQGGVVRGRNIIWNIKKLQPRKKVTLKASFMSHHTGQVINRVTAQAYCAFKVEASAKTDIIGIPAILLEVVDIQDPIAVNDAVTYLITVTNQGSAPGTNIKVSCSLEGKQSYISGKGATVVTGKNNTVTCAPYPVLKPGAKAKWRIKVKALKAGDIRFKVKMTSDQLSRPVEETEATTQY